MTHASFLLGKILKKLKKKLNKNFNSLCDWFVENKLSIHFAEDMTKSIIFGTRRRLKGLETLDIRRGNIKIKQHNIVEYLGSTLDNSLSWLSICNNVIGKISETTIYFEYSAVEITLQRTHTIAFSLRMVPKSY